MGRVVPCPAGPRVHEMVDDDCLVVSLEGWLATSTDVAARERLLRDAQAADTGARRTSIARLMALSRQGTRTSSPAQTRSVIRLLAEAQACLQAEQCPPINLRHQLALLRYETGLPLDMDLL